MALASRLEVDGVIRLVSRCCSGGCYISCCSIEPNDINILMMMMMMMMTMMVAITNNNNNNTNDRKILAVMP